MTDAPTDPLHRPRQGGRAAGSGNGPRRRRRALVTVTDGHGHGHGHGAAPSVRASRRMVLALGDIVAAVVASTVLGLVLLWPDGPAPLPETGNPYQHVQFLDARVDAIQWGTCEGTSTDRQPDGSIPDDVRCPTVTVTVAEDSPVDPGRRLALTPDGALVRAGLTVDETVRVARYADPGQPVVHAFADVERQRPLTGLTVAFVVLVVLVARYKGLAALAGLGAAHLAVIEFVIPALVAGRDPVLVALVASAGIMTVLLYLAHGVNVKTTTALLGTLAGLLVTAGVASWATRATFLTGLDVEEHVRLSQLTTDAGIGDVILCGIIIAGLGVLNDVTISQASAVWEPHAAAPDLGAGQLFTRAMRIGRDHLASVVYTIAFVYAGAALPTLMLQELYGRPLGDMAVSGSVAEELVRTLATSSSLVLTIPLTTAVAAALAAASGRRARRAHGAG